MKMMKIKMKMMKMKMMKMKVKLSMMMMKKVSHDDGYFVMKDILWWNLSKDESYLVMKVMIVREVMTGDVSPVEMFYKFVTSYSTIPIVLKAENWKHRFLIVGLGVKHNEWVDVETSEPN